MSMISDKIFLRSTASICDATLSFNFLVYCDAGFRLLCIDMMLSISGANQNGVVSE